MTSQETLLPPGFRFHPTDEELIMHYLRNRAASVPCPVSVVAEVDIYKFDPWELPAKAIYGDREWYFFSPRDRKYPNGVRPNRAAGSGYWKATGTDKVITAVPGGEGIGLKKALVFYKGRPPRGTKTNWIMHEYRLAETLSATYNRPLKKEHSSMRLDDWVLCRIYNKGSAATGTVAAAANQEQEEYSNREGVAQLLPWHEDPQMNSLCRMPKSLSFCELLDDGDYSVLARMLCDNPPLDMAAPASCLELGPLLGLDPSFSASDGAGVTYSLPKLAPADSSVSETESCRKRRKTSAAEHAEDQGDAACWPTKQPISSRVDYTGFFDQVEASPPNCSALSSSFTKQHMMFSSNLGLH